MIDGLIDIRSTPNRGLILMTPRSRIQCFIHVLARRPLKQHVDRRCVAKHFRVQQLEEGVVRNPKFVPRKEDFLHFKTCLSKQITWVEQR